MKLHVRIVALIIAMLAGLAGAVAVSSPAQAYDYGPFKLVNQVTGLCLEVPNGSMAFGEQLKIGVCGPAGTWHQMFYFSDAGPAFHYFIRPANNWWCLIPGNASLFRSTVVQWGCDWANGDEVFYILAPGGQGPLDPRILATANGFYLQPESANVGAYIRQGTVACSNALLLEHWIMVHQ